jgi:hypothetical protein
MLAEKGRKTYPRGMSQSSDRRERGQAYRQLTNWLNWCAASPSEPTAADYQDLAPQYHDLVAGEVADLRRLHRAGEYGAVRRRAAEASRLLLEAFGPAVTGPPEDPEEDPRQLAARIRRRATP